MAGKNLFSVPTTSVDTSEGPVTVPSFYYDGSAVTAFFMCDSKKIEPKLEGTGFVPAKTFGGKAFVSLGFFQYRDSCFGPYNEVVLMVGVYPAFSALPWWSTGMQFLKKNDKRQLGFYVLDLLLTERLPLAAGIEIWGLNKYKGDVTFNCYGDSFEGSVSIPETGEKLVTFTSPFGKGLKVNSLDNIFLSNLDGAILKTVVELDCPGRITTGKKVQIDVGSGDHPMIRNLRDLGIDSSRPTFVQTMDHLVFRLNEGIKICP